MKRRGADHIYGIVKDMTPEQELAYWQQRTDELCREQIAVRARNAKQKPAEI
jgi:hypothetical protein